MKTFNNKISKVLFGMVAITMISTGVGCKKMLDVERQGEYTSENYPYPKGSGPYDQYLFGAYNDLRHFDVHVAAFFLATSVRSDDADKGSTPTDGGANAIDMDNFPVLPANGFANGTWVGYYGLIGKCNLTLDQIENNKDIVATDAQKTQAQAEARFLRGYAYFNMVRFFGRIPLVDKVLTVSQSNVPQSTPAQIYALIESDLQFAAANLPSTWDPKFVGRANKWAASGLLAKVYLTQQKWAAAMGAANTVMTSGLYDLSTPYSLIFSEEGENAPKESLFEVQATATSTAQTANGVQYTQYQGVRAPGVWNLGFGWNTPSIYLEAAYEPNDPRKDRTILYRSTGTTTYKTVYGENTATTWENPRYNHKVYTNPATRLAVNTNTGYWMNVRLLRYADVVLIFAEAANEVGGAANITSARTALNSVRARARTGAPAGTLPDVTTSDQGLLRDAIRHERRIELAMEHDRFFDLVRWGVSQAVMSGSGKPNFIASRDNLLPIPQTQIDLSKGVLTQNPGY